MIRVFLFFLMLYGTLLADRDGGPYIGVGYGVSIYSDDGLYNNLQEDKSSTLTSYAGAYINKHLSVELTYVSFDAKNYGDGYIVDANKTLSFSAIGVSTLAHYAFFDDMLDFYARFGVGEMRLSLLAKSGFTMIYGAGVALRIDETINIKLAYDLYNFKYEENIVDNILSYKMSIDYVYLALEIQF